VSWVSCGGFSGLFETKQARRSKKSEVLTQKTCDVAMGQSCDVLCDVLGELGGLRGEIAMCSIRRKSKSARSVREFEVRSGSNHPISVATLCEVHGGSSCPLCFSHTLASVTTDPRRIGAPRFHRPSTYDSRRVLTPSPVTAKMTARGDGLKSLTAEEDPCDAF
jgi:hypothetical protein